MRLRHQRWQRLTRLLREAGQTDGAAQLRQDRQRRGVRGECESDLQMRMSRSRAVR